MTKVLSLRVGDDLAEWADEYAKSRGVTRQALLEEAMQSFREECLSGVPEIRRRAIEVAKGVGSCPKSEGGHVWASPREDPLRSCVHCGLHGREPARPHGEVDGGHFATATAGRAAFFGPMPASMVSGSGDAAKAYPKGLTPEQAARAALIVADKKRRDAEAVADGTARPGQIAGAPKGSKP